MSSTMDITPNQDQNTFINIVWCFSKIQGTKDLRNIQNAIKLYPNAQRHLFGVNSNAEPKPIEINKMLFLLVAAILTMSTKRIRLLIL